MQLNISVWCIYIHLDSVHNGLNKPAVKPIVFDQRLYKTLHFDNLKENKAQSTCAESTNKEINYHLKDVTQTQQQRPESPKVTLTWHASKYEVDQLQQKVHPHGADKVQQQVHSHGVNKLQQKVHPHRVNKVQQVHPHGVNKLQQQVHPHVFAF